MQDNPWQSRAKCKDLSIEESDKLFFLGRGGSPIRAQKFCSGCPVQTECRQEAILYDEEGIWAGLTDDQRNYLAPHLKPVLLKEARQEQRLKEFDLPPFVVPDEQMEEPLPPIHSWLYEAG